MFHFLRTPKCFRDSRTWAYGAILVSSLIFHAACEEPFISDFEPPEINIITPEDGADLVVYNDDPIPAEINDDPSPGEIVITAEVTDNEEVAVVQCHANFNLLGEKTEPPYTWTWAVSAEEAGNRRIWIVAQDAAGNERSTSILVNILACDRDFRDGSFEEQTSNTLSDPWIPGTDTMREPNQTGVWVEIGTGEAYDGNNCVKLITDSNWNWVQIRQELTCEPETDYEISCWVKADELYWAGRPKYAAGNLRVSDVDWNDIGTGSADNCSPDVYPNNTMFGCTDISEWTEITYNFTSPSTDSRVHIVLGVSLDHVETLRVDAFSMRKK